jgi:hypothetical protein
MCSWWGQDFVLIVLKVFVIIPNNYARFLVLATYAGRIGSVRCRIPTFPLNKKMFAIHYWIKQFSAHWNAGHLKCFWSTNFIVGSTGHHSTPILRLVMLFESMRARIATVSLAPFRFADINTVRSRDVNSIFTFPSNQNRHDQSMYLLMNHLLISPLSAL